MSFLKRLLGGGVTLAALTLSACQANNPDVETPTEATQQIEEVGAVKLAAAGSDKLLWGDTHLHTLNSADAFSFGARLSPADAYKFARGDEITSNTGQEVKLKRPLDFLVIADHAEGLGLINELYVGNPKLIKDPKAKRWHDMLNEGSEQSAVVGKELIVSHANGTLPKTMRNPLTVLPLLRSIWKTNNAIAEEFNDPGTFTALIGYEYTSMPDGNNIHRNIIFRDGKEKTDKILPFSSIQSDNPENLWKWMARYEKKTGGQVLAIPHNSNLSNGLMFAKTDFKGRDIDADYSKKRARWEPVVEITQIKGDSESHPFLSPNDEFSSFGDVGWDLGNLSLQTLKEQEMLKGDYVREALKAGLGLEANTGTNPFKLGLIGATDSHTGLATGDENNFFGKFGINEPNKERVNETIGLGGSMANRFGWQYLAGGYAGVWARDNTRAEIWDALKRKEVYGTTGPRMKVRFFGGNYEIEDAENSNMVGIGYEKGVPMGGDLQVEKDQSPQFIVAASKDPDGSNLDRAQIIKGWRSTDGNTHEKIYDVVWAGERKIGSDGKLPAIGSTVNTEEASYENSIGKAELTATWTDPDFDPAQAAFYYVRVLEIPTPRWPLFDAKRMGAEIPEGAELAAQERAYTSPIWYTPQ
jgi:Protein of unknown function (DUF3604)